MSSRKDPVKIFKSLSDETRLRILWLLDGNELSVNDMAEILGSTQSRVSRHLTVLRESNFLESRREGTWVYYRKPDDSILEWEIAQAWQFVREWAGRHEEAKNDHKRLKIILHNKRMRSRRFFGKHASHWDEIRMKQCGELVTLQAMESLIPPQLTVLDVGTGTGHLLIPLARIARKVIGVDHSPQMLNHAKENARNAGVENIELRQGEIDELPLQDEEVDAVFASLVLHHAPDPRKAIQEMVRVVKPGGPVTIIDLQQHAEEWMRDELADTWLGFEEEDMRKWFHQSGLTNPQWIEGEPPANGNAKTAKVRSFIFYGRKEM